MNKWSHVFLGLVLAAVAVVGTYWYEDGLERNEKSRQALQTIRQEIAEKERLASLGDMSIDLPGLTFGKLNDILRQPVHKLDSRGNSTRVGWACGGELCALEAAFAVPPGKNLPLSATPIQLVVSTVGFGKPFQGSIGGIRLGDSPDRILDVCRKHVYGAVKGNNRLAWDKDWEVVWDGDRKANLLIFWNMSFLNGLSAAQKEHGVEN